MKRKIAWLALPLVLFGLVSDVDAQAKRPVPTKGDLEARILMLRTATTDTSYYPRYRGTPVTIDISKLSKEESKKLIQCFHISPNRQNMWAITSDINGSIVVYFHDGGKDKETPRDKLAVSIHLGVSGREGVAVFHRYKYSEHTLDPATVKRWKELLLANPRIGPELRKRMNQ